MLNVIGKLLSSYILSLSIFIFMKTILTSKQNHNIIKNFISINILSIIIFIVHDLEYSAINPIVSFLTIVFELFLVYKINLTKSILYSTAFMIDLFIAELIGTIIFAGITTLDLVRSEFMYMVTANLIVGLVTISLIKIRKIKEKVIKIIDKLQDKSNSETIAFIFLLIASLSLVSYLFAKNYTYNNLFVVSVISIILFVILSFIFFKEKYEKEIILTNYDQLFEYAKTFEDWIDEENINIHESKNQLATLRDLISDNKEAIKYIDNITNSFIKKKSNNTAKLKYIPKGGLKGLLFYKINMTESQGIILNMDISEKVNNFLKDLTFEETKSLCRLVGIFFDNAIEASKESKTKRICCEIYLNKKNLNIVISNTYKGTIDLSKINEKGYSTKGDGRGKGLYLAHKLSSKGNMFKLENKIINNYYVQKIIMKKEC